ncbi:MAG: efflux RND transporter periplasmic adaptor subunit [Lentisphaeria bacterium]|nr:efflux RND transporter periplasmic adaptor subunit [Lentisphaeria bacterium]
MGDIRTTSGEDLPLTRRTARRRRLLVLVILAALVGGIVYAGIAVKVRRYAVTSGYVTTEEYAEVRPAAAGIVARIEVGSGAQVNKGDVLVYLEAEEEQATYEEARSRVQKIEVELTRRRAEIDNQLERSRVTLDEQRRNHEDAIAIARLQLKNAQSKLELTRELVEKGLKAGSALDDEQLKEQLAQAQLASLLARDLAIYQTLLERERAARETEITSMQQEMNALKDAVKRSEARLKSREIRAPISGQVLRYEFVIGELVRPETVLYEIFGGEKQVLKLRIAERFAARVNVGQAYSALLAPYRGLQKVTFEGTVEHLRNVIQAEGQNTYRVAYCSFHPKGYTISPGTTAEARIYYGRSCLWFYLLNIDN